MTHLTNHESGGVENAADADPEHKSVAEEDLLQPARVEQYVILASLFCSSKILLWHIIH